MSDASTGGYLAEDAADRRAALAAAIAIYGDNLLPVHAGSVLKVADAYYEWLRERDSLRVALTIEAGTPVSQDA
jgi:hypothetical protein